MDAATRMRGLVRTSSQEISEELEPVLYYFEAALANSGDRFTYLPLVFGCEQIFNDIGAIRTLEMARRLESLYAKYERLPDQDTKDTFWAETEGEREPIESAAEGIDEFAELVIAWISKKS